MVDYEFNDNGFWVVIGLTHAETEEFEKLDQIVVADLDYWEIVYPTKPKLITATEKRWLSLYDKHQAELRRR